MGKLVLIRHGESVWNTRNLFTGWVDVPLTQAGIVEATRASQVIKHIDFDVVYTSELVRAIQTALIVLLSDKKFRAPCMMHREWFWRKRYGKIHPAEAKNIIPIYRSWRLNERFYGDLQGLNKAKIADIFGVDRVIGWRKGYTSKPPKGENLKHTSKRLLPFFNKTIIRELDADKNVLVSSHANLLRSMVMHIEQLDEAQVVGLEMDTANPIIYNYVNGKFEREERMSPQTPFTL